MRKQLAVAAILSMVVLLGGAAPACAKDKAIHPRLFFAKSDVAKLRQLAKTTHAQIARNIIRRADAILKSPVPPYPEKVSYKGFTDPTGLPIPVALAWVLTGEQKYLDRTREMLTSFARWPHWGNERQVGQRDYALAWMLQACAVAYDWTYDALSEEDRKLIREALGRHTQEVYEAGAGGEYNRQWQNWWRTSYVQNHWHNCVFPMTMAALVLEGEDARAARWIEFGIGCAKLTSDVLKGIGDGTWHEGPHYQDGLLGTILPLYMNLKRLKGKDLLDEQYLRNYALWRIYNHVPGVPRAAVVRYSSFVPQWGGCIVGGGHASLRYVASQYADGRAQWLADRIVEAEPGMVAPFEFFYHDPSVKAAPPEGLPLERTFSDLEGVIWRTGWGDDNLAFALKTGAYGGRWVSRRVHEEKFPFDARTEGSLNAGHDHADANTFSLFWGKMELAGEMPDRVVINQTGGSGNSTSAHNTLLVDGGGQIGPQPSGRFELGKTDGRLERVCSAGHFNYLVADATNRYRQVDSKGAPGKRLLSEFRRHVLFVKPSYLLMVDSIRSAAPHRYDWVCHLVDDAPTDRVTVDGGWVRSPAGQIRPGRPWADQKAKDARVLGIRVLAPEGFQTEIGVSRYHSTFRPPKHKTFVKVRPPEKVADVRFVTVLFPTKTSAWASRPKMTLLADTAEAIGVRVMLDGSQDHLVTLGSAAKVTVKDYTLAGRAASVIRDSDGKLGRLFMAQGTRLSADNGKTLLLQAKRSTTVEAVYGNGTLALTGDELKGLRIYAPGVGPEGLTVNGKTTSPADAGVILLP